MLVPLGWILGCAAQLFQGHLWSQGWYLALMGLGGLLGLLSRWGRRKTKPIFIGAAVFLAFFALGFASTGWRGAHFQQQNLEEHLQGVDIVVEGVVVSLPQDSEPIGQRWNFAAEQAWNAQGEPISVPALLRLNHYNHSKDLQVHAGERWRWTLRLKRPRGLRNPRGFDTELRLWSQGIQATGYVRYPTKASTKSGQNFVKPELIGSTYRAPIAQARQWMRQRLASVADSSDTDTRTLSALGVVTALVTGDQAAIQSADWALFRDTGTAHLVSISGLHISMFAWLAMTLVGGLWRRSLRLCLWWPAPQAAAWAGLGLAALYAVFSGWGIPAQRTLLMLALAVGLRSLGLIWPWYRAWVLALAAVLLLDPWALLQAGFWLSFVAVGVIFLLNAHVNTNTGGGIGGVGGVGGILSSVFSLVRMQWWMSLVLAPLTLVLFGQISIVGFFANLWAIPLVTWVLTPLSMLGSLYAPLWTLATMCAKVLLAGLALMNTAPWAVVRLAQPPICLGVLAILGAAWMVWPWPLWMRLLGLSLIVPALVWSPSRPKTGEFEILALDVGQGSALLLRTAEHSLLWDAGTPYSANALTSFLRSHGEKLDKLIISHADLDHTGGAAAVLETQPSSTQLWGSGLERLAEDLFEDSRRKDWKGFHPCEQGYVWDWDGVRFRFLWPDDLENIQQKNTKSTNAQSCVLHVQGESSGAIFTGDLEAAQERVLLKKEGLISPTELLIVGHHGSKTSTSEAWLNALRPNVAIIQSGWRNRFGHPAPVVTQRLEKSGASIRNTAVCGAVRWRSERPKEAGCLRREEPRYWQND